MKKHGCHNVYWCYPVKRELSKVVKIASNQLNSEVTYNNYYVRLCFTMVHKVVHIDHDGLFLAQKPLKQMHHHLQLLTDVHHVMGANCTMCEPWHQNCVMVVPSQDGARTIGKLVQWLPHCECKDMIMKKGIVVGKTKGPMMAFLKDMRLYLQQFWNSFCLMTYENALLFHNSMQGF
jgi:hypothetical protein